jgi:hypothetical protein
MIADFIAQRGLTILAQEIATNGLPEWRAAPGKCDRYHERKAYRARLNETASR